MQWYELWTGYVLFVLAAVLTRLGGNLILLSTVFAADQTRATERQERLIQRIRDETNAQTGSLMVQFQLFLNSFAQDFKTTGLALFAITVTAVLCNAASAVYAEYHAEILNAAISAYRSEPAEGFRSVAKLLFNVARLVYNLVAGALLFFVHVTAGLKRAVQTTVAECAADQTKEFFIKLVVPFKEFILTLTSFISTKAETELDFTSTAEAAVEIGKTLRNIANCSCTQAEGMIGVVTAPLDSPGTAKASVALLNGLGYLFLSTPARIISEIFGFVDLSAPLVTPATDPVTGERRLLFANGSDALYHDVDDPSDHFPGGVNAGQHVAFISLEPVAQFLIDFSDGVFEATDLTMVRATEFLQELEQPNELLDRGRFFKDQDYTASPDDFAKYKEYVDARWYPGGYNQHSYLCGAQDVFGALGEALRVALRVVTHLDLVICPNSFKGELCEKRLKNGESKPIDPGLDLWQVFDMQKVFTRLEKANRCSWNMVSSMDMPELAMAGDRLVRSAIGTTIFVYDVVLTTFFGPKKAPPSPPPAPSPPPFAPPAPGSAYLCDGGYPDNYKLDGQSVNGNFYFTYEESVLHDQEDNRESGTVRMPIGESSTHGQQQDPWNDWLLERGKECMCHFYAQPVFTGLFTCPKPRLDYARDVSETNAAYKSDRPPPPPPPPYPPNSPSPPPPPLPPLGSSPPALYVPATWRKSRVAARVFEAYQSPFLGDVRCEEDEIISGFRFSISADDEGDRQDIFLEALCFSHGLKEHEATRFNPSIVSAFDSKSAPRIAEDELNTRKQSCFARQMMNEFRGGKQDDCVDLGESRRRV